jgi:hypothetical protein
MGAPTEWEEKTALPDSAWTFLIENCHNSSRSFAQPTMPGKISEMLETHNGTFILPEPGGMTNAVDSVGYKLKVGMASSSSTITALPSRRSDTAGAVSAFSEGLSRGSLSLKSKGKTSVF